jgi:hypothetical protein
MFHRGVLLLDEAEQKTLEIQRTKGGIGKNDGVVSQY